MTAAPVQQLFILNTETYHSVPRLYRSTNELTHGLMQAVLNESTSLAFPEWIRTEVRAAAATFSTLGGDGPQAELLNTIREILEDSHYAVFVHEVALPA